MKCLNLQSQPCWQNMFCRNSRFFVMITVWLALCRLTQSLYFWKQDVWIRQSLYWKVLAVWETSWKLEVIYTEGTKNLSERQATIGMHTKDANAKAFEGKFNFESYDFISDSLVSFSKMWEREILTASLTKSKENILEDIGKKFEGRISSWFWQYFPSFPHMLR